MKSAPIKYAISILLVGILIASLIAFAEQRIITVNTQNQPFIALGEYLKNISTKAHLWFEEAMSGDESIDLNRDVYGQLDRSTQTINAAINGEMTDLGKFNQTTDVETLAILNEAIVDNESLKKSAEKRWAFYQKSLRDKADTTKTTASTGEEAGGELDQAFDASYEELQETYDRLVNHIKKNVERDNSTLNALSWMSIGLTVIAFIILSYIIYKIQFRNDALAHSNSLKLKEEMDRLDSFNSFVQAISSNNYEATLDTNDELGIQLIKMRDTLKENSEMERRRIWASNGLAQIGEILRSDYKSVKELYDKILKFIVKYSGSNQGFLFLEMDDEEKKEHLELVAAYAYDRKKFLEKKVIVGEGLVGQCYLERAVIQMIDIPSDYIKITSGLGESVPTSLLIVPLIINETIYGILEMASFKKYEPHEVELIQKFAESVASTVSSVRINERTRVLLERSQQQTEEMRAQEEEMRQNMEELSATQEEMARKEREYIARIEELEKRQQ